MKKICIALAVVLCFGCAALGEEGVNIEVIRVDGVSVVVFTPEETLRKARGLVSEKEKAGFTLPAFLTLIEEEAFTGISAETVEVSESVVAIGPRAFADCPNLRQITIPATVEKVDDSALEGCTDVTVRGEKGTEAERFALDNGFAFTEIGKQPEEPPIVGEDPPVQLPFMPR